MPIRKILIANRGEIACRIIRTCREMGIAAVAVYSDADKNALHVEMANEAVHIGGSPPSASYLNPTAIIAAAKRTNADSIHPGFGFLAENADFAQAIIDAGLIFIGPPPRAIAAMGKKRAAKLLLKGIPVVPGYMQEAQSNEALMTAAADIGYPLMVKASAGGGGKGMRQVNSPADLAGALEAARREAQQAFGDDTLILERVVTSPRHVEIQIFGDQHGSIIALGERECTIQRRYQKIIEETPSTALTPDLRDQMCQAAVSIGEQLGYYSAGTVEFLVDAAGAFYFMEMNTRLQVEHPVTELVTGLDLVRWQILVAEGYPLPQTEVDTRGHAIEARIYAEDPFNDFLPATGRILRWTEPPGVRTDSGIRSGDDVTVYYDPMLAKVAAYGEHREGAIRRLDHALSQLQLMGIRSNIGFLRRVLMHPDHLAGSITTAFIAEHPDLLLEDSEPPSSAMIGAAIAVTWGSGAIPTGTYWRNNPNRPIRHTFNYRQSEFEIQLTPYGETFRVLLDGNSHDVEVVKCRDGEIVLVIDGHRQQMTAASDQDHNWWIHTTEQTVMLRWVNPLPVPEIASTAIQGSLRAPMPGKIIAVQVKVGQQVLKGDLLLTLEAMKMEHRIEAPYDGTVDAIHYHLQDSVQVDSVLLTLIPLDQ